MSLTNGAALSVSTYPSHGNQVSPPPDAQATAVAALSQQNGAQHAISIANGRKRRASGAPGSRGVANLTPEQLAKKRANDREAQRAIRERTRNTIESLEGRIKELESQQPFQELQRALQERDRAIEECMQLRQKLSSVAQVVGVPATRMDGGGGQHPGHAQQGSLSGTFALDDLIDPTWLTSDVDAELAALTAQQSPLPPLGHQLQQHPPPYPPVSGPPYDAHIHPGLRSPSYLPATDNSPASSAATGGPPYAQIGAQRRWSPNMEAPPRSQPQQQYMVQTGDSQDQQRPTPASMQPQHNGERLGVSFLLDPTQRAKTSSPSSQQAFASPQAHHTASPPLYAKLPNNSAQTCPLDALLGDFVATCRQQLATGVSMHEVLGPEYPSFAALHAADTPQRHHCHPVSALLIDILSKFPSISALPERVAVLYTMFLTMRWLICPCEGCYERLPEWVRPVTEQLEKPHAPWVDMLPWPRMRKQLSAASLDFDEFFVPFTTTLSINWPYPTDQILIPAESDELDGLTLSPVFEMYIRKLENWSVGSRFQTIFPGLVDGDVRVSEKA
ncbi:hypothetical protein LTR08_000770 [Meristemomyces frigidus]|nr:hypothetical protein LTR08_000770 [Meristemomyces frigidus]